MELCIDNPLLGHLHLRAETQDIRIAEASIAFQSFHYLVEYQIAVCKECQYAVQPDQIESHL
jgi:hypothetical protein